MLCQIFRRYHGSGLSFLEVLMSILNECLRINKVFEYLPLAALIEDKILCVHGGIGATIHTIDEIELI